MGAGNLEKWISSLVDCGEIGEQSNVLEIGCGTGRFTIPLWERTGAHITAIDPSVDMIRIARRKEHSEMVTWEICGAEHLPYPGSYFDCAYMFFVIQHLEEAQNALAEIYRVLRPGGSLVIATASHAMLRCEYFYRFFPGLLGRELSRFPSIPALKRLLAAVGYGRVRSLCVKGKPDYLTLDEYAAWVAVKPLSTFYLLTEEEFARGLARLRGAVSEERIRQFFVYHSCRFVQGERQENKSPVTSRGSPLTPAVNRR